MVNYLKSPTPPKHPIWHWLIQREKNLGVFILKHAILVEIVMIKIQIIIGYLLLRSTTIPLVHLFISGIVIVFVLRMILNKISRGYWFYV